MIIYEGKHVQEALFSVEILSIVAKRVFALLRMMRLHTPVGIFLLFFPSCWAILLASQSLWEALPFLFLFFTGAVLMRGAGCVINDIWDRNIDQSVRRTKKRPLAQGVVTVPEALVFLCILALLGLLILLQFNLLTIVLGCIFSIFVGIYPLTKRFLRLPQIFLAITFGAGALMGWSAVANHLPLSSSLLYTACAFWIFGYDTLYAYQDREDDRSVGVYSSALTLERWGKTPLVVCYAAFLLLLGVVFWREGLLINAATLFVGSLALMLLGGQLLFVRLEDPQSCNQAFIAHVFFGGLVSILIFLGHGEGFLQF